MKNELVHMRPPVEWLISADLELVAQKYDPLDLIFVNCASKIQVNFM